MLLINYYNNYQVSPSVRARELKLKQKQKRAKSLKANVMPNPYTTFRHEILHYSIYCELELSNV